MKYDNRNVKEVELKEEATEPFAIEEPKDEKKPGFWSRNGKKIIIITYYGAMAALVIGGIIKGGQESEDL